LKGKDINASLTEAYDRFFLTEYQYFIVCVDDDGEDNGGVFNPFNYVYKLEDVATYKSAMEDDYTGDRDTDEPVFLRAILNIPGEKTRSPSIFQSGLN